MNLERLQQLRRVVAGVPEEQFSLHVWHYTPSYPDAKPVGCALGWACRDGWFRQQGWSHTADGRPLWNGLECFTAAREFFGRDLDVDIFCHAGGSHVPSMRRSHVHHKRLFLERLDQIIAAEHARPINVARRLRDRVSACLDRFYDFAVVSKAPAPPPKPAAREERAEPFWVQIARDEERRQPAQERRVMEDA